MNSKRVFLFSFLGLTSLAAQAGVVIEYVKRNADTGKEEPLQTMSVQNGMARFEIGGQRPTAGIFKNDALYTLEPATKKYMVIDKAAIEQSANMMNDAMAKMRAQMEKMPPEQRAMMENMMKQRGAMVPGTGTPQKSAIYDAQPTGGSETINGKSCKLWNITRDDVLSQQLCVVPMNAMPGADEAVAMFKRMSATFEKLGQAARGMFDNTLRESSAAYAKINGFPIVTRAYKDGKLAPEQTVVKTWKQQAIDATKFEVPADYTKQEMPKMGERK